MMRSQSSHTKKSAGNIMNARINSLKTSLGMRLLLYFAMAVLFYITISSHLLPQTYDIEPGMVSESTIYAPKQIQNEAATKKAQDDAAAKVQPVFTVVEMRNKQLMGVLFDKIAQINADESFTQSQKNELYPSIFQSEYEAFYHSLTRSFANADTYNESVQTAISKGVLDQQYRIPVEAYFKFTRLTAKDLEDMEPVAIEIVGKLMGEPIDNAETARAKVAELVNSSSLSAKLSRELLQEMVRFVITPNKFSDAEASLEAKDKARENVEPVYIQKNDALVKQGEVISPEIYQILQDLDLLSTEFNYAAQAGLLVMILLIIIVLFMYIRQSQLPIRHNNVQLFMLLLIFLLNIVGMKIVALGSNLDFDYVGYLAPVAMGSMLIAILLDASLALICSVMFAILSSVIFNAETSDLLFNFRFGFITLIVCFIAVFAIHRASQRSVILKAGLLVSLFAAISVSSIVLLGNEFEQAETIVLSICFAIASGILTSVFVIGLLPFFEASFGILSALKLIELSNPNHPLLRKLLVETPGTYHHSVMVGNLSESAAEAIGANGLLCRVGSFYHDVGKTKRPSYFIENQGNMENPHDQIEPSLSTAIITAHARDGVEMLKEYKMPKQLCDIAEQHHGTTLLKYFYHKAVKQAEEKGHPIDFTEEDYRYPGPKAQSKEAAIVGIADCVEAAVRSLRSPSMEQISLMVDKIIKDRLEDNQFNQCDITLKELDIIGSTLKESLLGIFHSRIEYPELPKKENTAENTA